MSTIDIKVSADKLPVVHGMLRAAGFYHHSTDFLAKSAPPSRTKAGNGKSACIGDKYIATHVYANYDGIFAEVWVLRD